MSNGQLKSDLGHQYFLSVTSFLLNERSLKNALLVHCCTIDVFDDIDESEVDI